MVLDLACCGVERGKLRHAGRHQRFSCDSGVDQRHRGERETSVFTD